MSNIRNLLVDSKSLLQHQLLVKRLGFLFKRILLRRRGIIPLYLNCPGRSFVFAFLYRILSTFLTTNVNCFKRSAIVEGGLITVGILSIIALMPISNVEQFIVIMNKEKINHLLLYPSFCEFICKLARLMVFLLILYILLHVLEELGSYF